MKPFGYLLITVLCFYNTQTSHSQTKNNPWTASFGTNAINNPVRDLLGEEGRFKTWNWNAAGFRLSAGRLITNKITFEGVASLNTIAENYKNLDVDYPYISLDAMFKYQLTKGLFVVDPYLTIGGGYTWLDTIGAGTVNGGIGINFWVTDHFGFTIQTVYKHAFEEYGLKHYQHSTGIVFKFGGKDADKDGILDENDACPELFGTIETKGCPDRDKDGVIDSEDLCPDNFGPTFLRGCPDNDGDGTPDKYDKCPEQPGEINDDGCPLFDTDKDGIADKYDKCPEQPGSSDNNGCPLNQQQQAQLAAAQQQQIIERNKAIKLSISNRINALTQNITFNNGQASLTYNGKTALDEISTIMLEQVNMKFHIAGHTDNLGSTATNLALSEKRADTVRKYLILKGIEATRMTSQGYGEGNPIAENSTNQGRIKNRRVEIFIVN